MAHKRTNVPPKNENKSSGDDSPGEENGDSSPDSAAPADADDSDHLHKHILANPHVIAALQALPARERFRNRLIDALDSVYFFFVAHLDENDVDHALFALFERPIDEAVQLEGKKGTTHGSLYIIASDADMSYRQVERRFQRMNSRIVTAHMLLLLQDLRRHSLWEHYGNIQSLLDTFIPSC